MTTLRPLPLWPHNPPAAVMALVRQAKADLNLPFMVMPGFEPRKKKTAEMEPVSTRFAEWRDSKRVQERRL